MAKPFRNPEGAGTMMGSIKADMMAAMLEFLGMFTWLFLALGGIQAASAASSLSYSSTGIGHGLVRPDFNTIQLFYNSAALGLSLLITCWIFYRTTGAIFNPNVATALLLLGVIGPVRWVMYCVAHILGAIAASAVVLALVPGPLFSNTFAGPLTNKPQALFMEMFLTAILILSVLVLVTARNGSRFAPVGIGLTMFACSLFGYQYTGASMNTARSFGPAVVSGFWRAHWIYWLGPFMGSLLAVAVYTLLRRVYWWPLDHPNVNANLGAPDLIGTQRGANTGYAGGAPGAGAGGNGLGAGGYNDKAGRPSTATAVDPNHRGFNGNATNAV